MARNPFLLWLFHLQSNMALSLFRGRLNNAELSTHKHPQTRPARGPWKRWRRYLHDRRPICLYYDYSY